MHDALMGDVEGRWGSSGNGWVYKFPFAFAWYCSTTNHNEIVVGYAVGELPVSLCQ